MASGSVWVTLCSEPANMIVAPNSPRPRANARRLAGGEPAARERQHDAEEYPPARPRACAQLRSASGRPPRRRRWRCARRTGAETKATAITTAVCVNGSDVESRPTRPNAASRPIPATAGGSTSGSSTNVINACDRGNCARPAGTQQGYRRGARVPARLRSSKRDDERVAGDRIVQLVHQRHR